MNLKDPSVFDKVLGAKIREVRVKRGITVKEVAQAIQSIPEYVLKIENGDIRLSVFLMHKLLRFLEVRNYVITPKKKRKK